MWGPPPLPALTIISPTLSPFTSPIVVYVPPLNFPSSANQPGCLRLPSLSKIRTCGLPPGPAVTTISGLPSLSRSPHEVRTPARNVSAKPKKLNSKSPDLVKTLTCGPKPTPVPTMISSTPSLFTSHVELLNPPRRAESYGKKLALNGATPSPPTTDPSYL